MELWDVYTKTREKTGRTHIRESKMALGEGEYHIVIDVWTFLPDGKLLLTQRDPAKPKGLKWEGTGGSITTGETSVIGAVREVEEEIGLQLNPDDLVLAGEIVRDNSLIDVYVTRLPYTITVDELTFQEGEVVDAKLVTKEEFFEMGKAGLLTMNMLPRYERFQELIDPYFEPLLNR